MPFNVTMPKLSPTMESGTIAKWHAKEGDLIEADSLLMEVSTDKATVEYNALDGGYLRKILVQEGQEAQVNQPIAIFTETKDEPFSEGSIKEEPKPATPDKEEGKTKPAAETPDQPKAPVEAPKVVTPPSDSRIKASPLAKKLAADKNIDLSRLSGTGPGGRIVSRDLPEKRQEVASGTFEEQPLSPIRKVIAQRLQEAKSTIPHFYLTLEIDADPLTQFREQLVHLDKKVSFNDCVIKACALALRDHPQVNSGFAKQTILLYKTIDISVAVSTDNGLITPIVTHADSKSLFEISENIRALGKKAREGKLAPQEFQGGSFTVSNLGMYGITHFQAIINPPQSAILAVGGILDRPVVKNNQVVPGKVMNLTLSCDHRIVDGVLGAQFLKSVQNYLEHPAALLLDS